MVRADPDRLEAMTINPDLQGRSYPAAEVYDVGREKIREFARAVKATHPAHFDVDAAKGLGHRDLVAPPTFAIIIAQRADAQLIEDPEAGIDFSRVVHADQRFTHHRPIFAGDPVNRSSGHTANPSCMLSTTWLATSRSVVRCSP